MANSLQIEKVFQQSPDPPSGDLSPVGLKNLILSGLLPLRALLARRAFHPLPLSPLSLFAPAGRSRSREKLPAGCRGTSNG
jgi:hypothetical protein